MPCHAMPYTPYNYVVIVLKLFVSINAFYYMLYVYLFVHRTYALKIISMKSNKKQIVFAHISITVISSLGCVCVWCVSSVCFIHEFLMRNTCDFAFHAMGLAREVILFKRVLLLSLYAFITINNYRVWFASGMEGVTVFLVFLLFCFWCTIKQVDEQWHTKCSPCTPFWTFQLASAIQNVV